MRIVVGIIDCELRFDEHDEHLKDKIHQAMHSGLGVQTDGFQYARAYKTGHWDGITDFYNFAEDKFPTGLLTQVDTILGGLQNKFSFQYEIIEDRPDPFMEVDELDKEIELIGDNDDIITLRDYQYDSVKSTIESYTGIINVATNGGKCLSAHSYVQTNKGLQTIGDLFAENGVEPDSCERVIANTFGVQLVNRYGVLESPSHFTVNGDRHTSKIKTSKGYEVTATKNHPLLTVSTTGRLVWKNTEDIKVGDWLVSRKGDNVFGDNSLCSKESAYVLGALIADGYFGSRSQVTFTNNQETLLKATEEFFNKEGLPTRISPNKTSPNSFILRGIGTLETDFYSKYHLFNGVAKDKEVPKCILEAPREIQMAFLSGYLECEMSIEVPKCSIEVTSASSKLLQQIQLMLLNMGFVGTLLEKKVNNYENNWYGKLTLGAICSERLLKELSFRTEQRMDSVVNFNKVFSTRKRNPKGQQTPFGKSIVKLYKDTYPSPPKGMKKDFDFPKTISIERLRELVVTYPNGLPEIKNILDVLLDDNLVLTQVTAVIDEGVQPTFDVCMPITHSFIGGGIVNHNTEIASGVIDQLLPRLEAGERIAFFTNSSSIFTQSIDRIEKRLDIKVGRYGNGKKEFKQVTFVMIPTLTAALKVDPEAGLKLTPKERIIKKMAKEIAPRFLSGVNQRRMLEIYVKNNVPKTQADKDLLDYLEDIYYSCGSDKEVLMKLKGYEVEYQKIVQKKNKKVFEKYNEAVDFLESIAVMIVDEAHHTSSDTWYTSLRMCINAQYRMALTGSIDKKNAMLWQRMQALFGEVIAKTSNQTLIDLGHSAKPKITLFPIGSPNLTGLLKEIDIDGRKKQVPADYMAVYEKGIVENEYRNLLVAKLAKIWYDKDKGVLIIVNRIEHGEILSELLDDLKVEHYFIHGELDLDLREEKLEDMRTGKLKVMIATSIVDEGVDISGLDALILAAGGKSLRQTLQRVGRVLRKKKVGENVCAVFDFTDNTHKYLKKHSDERKKIYKEEQFEIVDVSTKK